MPKPGRPGRVIMNPGDRRRAAAQVILEHCDQWQAAWDRNGNPYFKMKGSGGAVYQVTTKRCTCPDNSVPRAGRLPGPCKHRMAATLYKTVIRAYQLHRDQLELEREIPQ